MITRRSFLGSLSAVPSVAALHSMRGQASTLAASILNSPNTDGRPSHATFHSLAPGAVKPEGWLGQYLDKQAKGLSLHLPERSEERRVGKECREGGWGEEYKKKSIECGG